MGDFLLSCESSLPKGDVRHSLGPPAYGSPLSKVYIPFCSPSRVTAEMGQQRFSSLFWQMNLWGQWQNWQHGRQCLCIYCIVSGWHFKIHSDYCWVPQFWGPEGTYQPPRTTMKCYIKETQLLAKGVWRLIWVKKKSPVWPMWNGRQGLIVIKWLLQCWNLECKKSL